MASGQDIAGIAALAGLGYMLANRKKKEAEDTSSKADIASMKQDASSAGDESAEDTQKLPIRPGQQRSGMMMPTRPGQQRSGMMPKPIPSGGPGRSPSGPGPGAGRGGQGGPNVPTTAAMPPVGSGRGGQGGPSADEIAASRMGGSGRGGQGGPSADEIAASRMGGSGRGGQGGPSAEELSNAKYNIRPSQEDQQSAIGTVTGAYGGGPNIKAVAAMAKNAANRGAAAAPAAAQGTRNAAQQAMDRATAAEMAARTTKGTVPRPASQAPTTEFNFKQAVDAQNRVKNQPGYKQMLENEMRDADLPYKRGGKTKAFASGGSVKSSASSRGDGIASRGKTRGRIY